MGLLRKLLVFMLLLMTIRVEGQMLSFADPFMSGTILNSWGGGLSPGSYRAAGNGINGKYCYTITKTSYDIINIIYFSRLPTIQCLQ